MLETDRESHLKAKKMLTFSTIFVDKFVKAFHVESKQHWTVRSSLKAGTVFLEKVESISSKTTC